jgi:hypothetical protein
MSDARLRELERRWQESGSVEDEAALLAARTRAGQLEPCALRLQAYLGHPAARRALGEDPEPTLARPGRRLNKALERFGSANGVVDHLAFACEDLAGPAGHELVAREMARFLLMSSEEEERARDPDATRGERVSLEAVLGARFDLAGRRLLFPSAHGLLPPAEAEAVRAATNGWGSSDFEGYARAFSDPPYGLSIRSLVKIERLFLDMWRELIGSFEPAEVEVYSWTTEQWSYWDAGREWWGSFLWTVRPPGDRPWVGIAASATD